MDDVYFILVRWEDGGAGITGWGMFYLTCLGLIIFAYKMGKS